MNSMKLTTLKFWSIKFQSGRIFSVAAETLEAAIGIGRKIMEGETGAAIHEVHVSGEIWFAQEDPVAPNIEASVGELELSVRASNCLYNANITTVGELCKLNRRDLLRMKYVGSRTVNEIEAELDKFGLRLAR